MPRRKAPEPNYALRDVYVDYLHRFAWYVTSRGQRSRNFPIFDDNEESAVKAQLWKVLDELDPIPSDVEIPFRVLARELRHLRLLSLILPLLPAQPIY